MTDADETPEGYETFYAFKADVQAAREWLRDIDMDLQAMDESPRYDEPYKLGPAPDLQAVKDATKLLEQAQHKLAQFMDSVTNRPT